MTEDCIVRLIDLPAAVGGLVAVDKDGFNNIYINARWGYKGQRRAYKHEMTHVVNDDAHNDDDIRTIEARADNSSRRLPRLIKARDLIPSKPVSRKIRRDMFTLRRIGVIANCDPLLDLPSDRYSL